MPRSALTRRPNRWDGREWNDFGRFYSDVYGQAIIETHRIGRVGATLLRTDQSEGDWSDPPTPALVVTMMTSRKASASVDIGAGRINDTMRLGEFIVVAPDTATDVIVHGRCLLQVAAIPWAPLRDLTGPDAGLPPDGDFGPLHTRTSSSRHVVNVARRLWSIARTPGPHSGLAADGTLIELAAALLDLRDGAPRRPPTELAPWRLRRVTEALAESAPDTLSLAELAALVDLSSAHFARAFKASTGVTPHQWAFRHRISKAETELSCSSASIAEIAAANGFASQQHFTTAFKRHTGTTPAAWRRNRP